MDGRALINYCFFPQRRLLISSCIFLYFLPSSFGSLLLPTVWKRFGLTDTQQDYHHSAPWDHSSLPSILLLHLHSSLYPSIYPSIHPSIATIPGLLLSHSWSSSGFPFPSHHSAVHVCGNLCNSLSLFDCHIELLAESFSWYKHFHY